MPPYMDYYERGPYHFGLEIDVIPPLGPLTHAATVKEIRHNATRARLPVPRGLHVHHGVDEIEAAQKALSEAERILREGARR